MKIFAQNFNLESPHYSTIRQWFARVGLYELNREKEKLQDWIYVIDLTLELGQEKGNCSITTGSAGDRRRKANCAASRLRSRERGYSHF